ncbi:hypothetical protein BDQ12DRAFT_567410, partial [Crucibulum laeve]
MIIDDRNSAVKYMGKWESLTGVQFEYQNTSMWTEEIGATSELAFNGTSISVFGMIPSRPASDPSRTIISSYTIDGSHPTNFTGITPSDGHAQFNVTFYKSPNLEPGEHTLVVTNLNGAYFNLDYFQIIPLDSNF